ncbi:hypothetical protein [Streptomyces sp. IBSBF 3136]|uniref:hypothetical protein n=1 Tax=Streptomyces sp. IBSBF 3136 TaxID=2903524 RepID=UPI002FDC62BC
MPARIRRRAAEEESKRVQAEARTAEAHADRAEAERRQAEADAHRHFAEFAARKTEAIVETLTVSLAKLRYEADYGLAMQVETEPVDDQERRQAEG